MLYSAFKTHCVGSLVKHRQIQHSVDKGWLGSEGNKADGGDGGDYPRTFRLAFPAREGPRPFPVEGSSVRALMRMEMRVPFCHRHVRDTVVILEEGNLHHPQCPLCGMLMPWKALNWTHIHTAQCNRGAERKRRRFAAEEER